MPRLLMQIPVTPKKMSKLFAMLLVVPWISFAFAEDFIPANFRAGSESLQNRMSFPHNAEDGTVVIKCAGAVKKSGYFGRGIVCFPNNQSEQSTVPFIKAILSASERIKLTPAYVNGWRREVWFNFSVAFNKDGDQKIIEVYPNHLYNYNEYGESYTEPQRYEYWAWRWPAGCRVTLLLISTEIDSSGNASDTKLAAGKPSHKCEQKFIEEIENSSYIPATHEGKHVPAKYVEIFYTGNQVPRIVP